MKTIYTFISVCRGAVCSPIFQTQAIMPLRLLPFFIALLSLPIFSAAQQTTTVQVQPERLFIYGDFVYPANFHGMKRFMADLPELDPAANRLMQPEWQRIKQKRNLGGALLWGGMAVGAIWGSSGLIPKEREVTRTVLGQPVTTTEKDYSAAYLRFLAGTTFMLGSGLAGWLIMRGSNDPTLFLNTFNKGSQNEKLRLSTGTSVGPGLGLYYRLE